MKPKFCKLHFPIIRLINTTKGPFPKNISLKFLIVLINILGMKRPLKLLSFSHFRYLSLVTVKI